MKRERKNLIVSSIIILLILVLAFFLLNKDKPETKEEIVKCIGSKSIFYTQLGCHACKIQEDLFGENYKYITVVDCWFEIEKCINITATPTWLIDGEKIIGVQSVEKLQDLTGC